MKADRRLLLALVAVAALGLVVWLAGRPAGRAPEPRAAAAPAAAEAPRKGAATAGAAGAGLPEIGLARATGGGRSGRAGRRDIFAFGPAPTQPPPPGPPPTAAPPPTAVAAGPPPAPVPTGPPPPPPLNVKFIGSVEEKRSGLKVAVLLTDRQEILTGKPGEVVANRLKIVSIGLESVDVQDVGGSGVRRIPLKGN